MNTDEDGLLLPGPDNVSVKDATGAGISGWGSYNPNQPSHLLWYEGRFEGWVFVMVYNQMLWDGTASVCSQRVIMKRQVRRGATHQPLFGDYPYLATEGTENTEILFFFSVTSVSSVAKQTFG